MAAACLPHALHMQAVVAHTWRRSTPAQEQGSPWNDSAVRAAASAAALAPAPAGGGVSGMP